MQVIAATAGSGGTENGGAATTSAWIAASVALVVGSATVCANLWIASRQRQVSIRQPVLERSAASAHERDGRIRAVIEATETIRLRCWQVSTACRGDGSPAPASYVGDIRRRLSEQTDLLQGHADDLHRYWAPLRPELSSSEHDQLLARRIACMEALDALVTNIAASVRTTAVPTTRVRTAVDVLDAAARAFGEDLMVLRRAWATDSGIVAPA